MSQSTTMKTTRETLDRIRPYAVFRESWDTALNKALDILDDLRTEIDEDNSNPKKTDSIKQEYTTSDIQKLFRSNGDKADEKEIQKVLDELKD